MRPNPYAGPKFMSKIEPKTLQSSPPKMAGAAAPSRGETAADAAFAALFGGVMLAEKASNGPAKSATLCLTQCRWQAWKMDSLTNNRMTRCRQLPCR
ncbi:MAG: hypothetical protein VW520_05730 [Candidatus Puniceispirillum sp.]